jgi:hypothetical protein
VEGVLVTELRHTATVADVEAWRERLDAAVAGVPANGRFKLLLDLRGYEPADLAAHKAMRDVVPGVLLRHGMRPAFLDLFDDPPHAETTTERGVVCTAFANVHHDAEKMAEYERRIGRPDQRFFTDRSAAEEWLGGLP